MIKVTMQDILDYRNTVNTFSNQPLPLKGAYKLNKIKHETDETFEFYQNKFKEIIEKYAKRDEKDELVFSPDGEQIMIKDELIEECNEALNDLMSIDVEINNQNLVLEDLGENITCTPEQLDKIMKFFS